jgi:hypothetical protein
VSIFTSDVARRVWPVATHQGELTARRLVITQFDSAGRPRKRGILRCRARVPIGPDRSPR